MTASRCLPERTGPLAACRRRSKRCEHAAPPRAPARSWSQGLPSDARSRVIAGHPRERVQQGNIGCPRLDEESVLVMILPQVHLRKPCYDFYFL